MDNAVITVEARIMGQRKSLIARRQVALVLPPRDGPGEHVLRLRNVLTQVVRQEVEAFTQRQQEQSLVRVLSPDEIEQATASGKIAMGGVEARSSDALVSAESAIAVALQAFADGLYIRIVCKAQLPVCVLLRLEPHCIRAMR